LLEHHADMLAQLQLVELRVIHLDAQDLDGTALKRHQRVHAADQGRFSGSGRPDDTSDFAFRYSQAHAFDDFDMAE
jgi:hypothetical protein